MFESISNLFFCVLFVLFSASLGRRLLFLFKVKFESFGIEILFSFAVGSAVVGYLTFFLGLAGLFYKWFFTLLFLLGFLLLLKEEIHLTKMFADRIKRIKVFDWDFFTTAIGVILGLHMFFILFSALSPNTASDALGWWIGLPKIWIEARRISDVPYMLQSYWPFLMPMIYSFLALVKGFVPAKLIHFFFAVCCAGIVYIFSRTFLSKKGALLGSAIFFCVPPVYSLAGSCFVDFGIVFYNMLALFAFYKWYFSSGDRENYKWFWLSSVFLGISFSIKLTGILPVIIFVAFALYRRCSIKKIIGFSVLPLVIASVWYIRSFIYTGNPFYPFEFLKLFNFGAIVERPGIENIVPFSRIINFLVRYIRFPWDITVNSQKYGYLMESPTPFYLAFIPLLILIRKMDKRVKFLLVYAIGYITLWSCGRFVITRYLLPVFPVLAMIGAYVFGRLSELGRGFKKILIGIVLFMFVWNLALAGRANTVGVYNKFPVVLGFEERDVYLSRVLNYYDVFKYMENNLPEDAKIVFFWQVRRFYCKRDCIWGDIYYTETTSNFPYLKYSKMKSAWDLMEDLKKLKVTHIMVNDEVKDMKDSPIWHPGIEHCKKLQDDLIERYARLIYEKNRVHLYEL